MATKRNLSAIIAAAGAGRRMGGVSKPFMRLGGRLMPRYSLEMFAALKAAREIIVVVNPRDMKKATRALAPLRKRCRISHIVAGGKMRQESVANGLACVSEKADLVAVHDAARPFATAKMVRQLILAAHKVGAAIPAVRVKDTVKRVDKRGRVVGTVYRDGLWQVQTPQVFEAEVLKEAYRRAGDLSKYTDDAQLVERLGRQIVIVESNYDNIKITTPEDLALARFFLRGK